MLKLQSSIDFSGLEPVILQVFTKIYIVNAADQPTDAEVAQGCTAGGSQASSKFIVTGRGGLPANPKEALSSDAIQVDWVTLNRLKLRRKPHARSFWQREGDRYL